MDTNLIPKFWPGDYVLVKGDEPITKNIKIVSINRGGVVMTMSGAIYKEEDVSACNSLGELLTNCGLPIK